MPTKKEPDGGDMEKKVEIVVVSVVIGLILLVMLPVQAIPTDHASRTLQPGGDVNERITKHLEKLEDAGYDVSEIRAAVESGDMETARTLLREFMEEHRDEFPANQKGGMRGTHCRTAILEE